MGCVAQVLLERHRGSLSPPGAVNPHSRHCKWIGGFPCRDLGVHHGLLTGALQGMDGNWGMGLSLTMIMGHSLIPYYAPVSLGFTGSWGSMTLEFLFLCSVPSWSWVEIMWLWVVAIGRFKTIRYYYWNLSKSTVLLVPFQVLPFTREHAHNRETIVRCV